MSDIKRVDIPTNGSKRSAWIAIRGFLMAQSPHQKFGPKWWKYDPENLPEEYKSLPISEQDGY